MGIAVLVMRVVIGIAFVLHGTPKIEHAATWMNAMAFHPPAVLQVMAAVAEFFGGWALILGVATPVAALLIGIDMIVAITAVHIPHGAPLVSSNGESLELPGLYLVGTIAIILAGPRQFSIDALIGRHVPDVRSRLARPFGLSS
jgi:putative oxidoreductase